MMEFIGAVAQMDKGAWVGLLILVCLMAFWAGAALIVYSSQYQIKTGKGVPKYLKDVGIKMPNSSS